MHQLPRIPRHLSSRESTLSSLAESLYWTINASGLRLPARRDLARHALVSEPTISRRLRAWADGEERLVARLVLARQRTYPPGYAEEGWSRWIPQDDADLQDARAWLACLTFASSGEPMHPVVRQAVCETWWHEHDEVVRQLVRSGVPTTGGHEGEASLRAEIVQSLLLGLSLRRLLDPDCTAQHAEALLDRAVASLGG
ncbi:TetR family transcriptional regulator C-terminal domain-containing protein [Nocardioides KLBMP 9356]|uniref:TetR family transcriptional regulator C-terminal domain-containing protein n=1 Tax=Nocardioides potassii TaxID=2911371 RepID=A0ABS9H4Q0_9ACTN|nr:TetR family transcriptional regulator C-terminal domain-containing protein [Nocardioides potassii]MCF6376240.1 TetR family transcriptional regulator C-terminal domain-containing protein [Nocardioides potassii]